MIKKWLQVIWYEHKQPYPPPTYVLKWGRYLFLLVIVESKHLKIKISKNHMGPGLGFKNPKKVVMKWGQGLRVVVSQV
jgi:hypothetical protein